MKKSKYYFITLLAILGLLLAACGNDSAGDAGKDSVDTEEETTLVDPEKDFAKKVDKLDEAIEGGTLNYGLVSDAAFKGILDWAFYEDNLDAEILSIFSEPIFAVDENYEITNDRESAAKFEIADDLKSIKVTIQDGVYWHNGEPLEAEDYAYSFYIIGHPDYTGVRYGDDMISDIVGMEAYHKGETNTIEGIEIHNDKELTIRWTEPKASLKSGLWTYAAPKDYYGDVDIADLVTSEKIHEKAIGFGPFKINKVVPGESVEFIAFEDYYGGKPKLDSIVLRVIPTSTIVEEINSGNVDIASFPTNQYTIGMDTPNYELLAQEQNAYTYIAFKLGRWDAEKGEAVQDRDTPLQDKALRQAFGYAMDNQTIAEQFYQGLRKPANSLMIPFFKDYHNPDLEGYTFDPEKAKQILDEAGFKDVDGDGFREDKDGKPMVFNFASMSGGETAEPIAQYYIQNWKEVGLNVQLLEGRLHEPNNFYDRVEADDPEIDIYQAAWGTGTDPNPYGLYSKNAPFNYPRFVNEENERLLAEGASEKAALDKEYRKEVYNQWQELMFEEAPAIPTLFRYELIAVNDRVAYYSLDQFDDFGWEQVALTEEEPVK